MVNASLPRRPDRAALRGSVPAPARRTRSNNRRNPRPAEIQAEPWSLPSRRARAGDAGSGLATGEAIAVERTKGTQVAQDSSTNEIARRRASMALACMCCNRRAGPHGPGGLPCLSAAVPVGPRGLPCLLAHRVGTAKRPQKTEGTRAPQESWKDLRSSCDEPGAGSGRSGEAVLGATSACR